MMLPKSVNAKQEDMHMPQNMGFPMGGMGFPMGMGMGGPNMRMNQSQTDEILQSFNISSVSNLNMENN
jgi:hypothetical protein